MGVQRLQTFLRKNKIGEKHTLSYFKDKKTIIDGDSVAFYFFESLNSSMIFGGEFKLLRQKIEYFLQYFINNNLNVSVIFDGIPPEEKLKTIMERRRTKSIKVKKWWKKLYDKTVFFNYTEEIPINYPCLIRRIFVDVLRNLNIKIIHSRGENDDEIVSRIQNKEYDLVIAKDTDFLIYDIPIYVPINYISIEKNKMIVITKELFCSSIGLPQIYLPLFSCLAGNDITHGDNSIKEKLFQIHLKMKPDVLLCISKAIKSNMYNICNFIFLNPEILDAVNTTYKKYNMSLYKSNLNLNTDYKELYDEYKLDTDCVFLLNKRKRLFQQNYSNTRNMIIINMIPLRRRIYGYLFKPDEKVQEEVYSVTDGILNNEVKYIEPIKINKSNNKLKQISIIFEVDYIDICKLDNYFHLPFLSLLVMIKTNILKNKPFKIIKKIVKHLHVIKNNIDINTSFTNNQLIDPWILECVDSYLCCMQEVLFCNQLCFHPLEETKIWNYYCGSIFYKSLENKIDCELDEEEKTMISILHKYK